VISEIAIYAAAAPRAFLVALFTVFLPFEVPILAPSLIFLYWTFRTAGPARARRRAERRGSLRP